MYPLEIAQEAAKKWRGLAVLDILLAMDLDVRQTGFEDDDGFGDIGTVPRLAEAIAQVTGLPPHLTLQAIVSEGDSGTDYYGGWPVMTEDDEESRTNALVIGDHLFFPYPLCQLRVRQIELSNHSTERAGKRSTK